MLGGGRQEQKKHCGNCLNFVDKNLKHPGLKTPSVYKTVSIRLLYLFHNLLDCRSVGCVEEFSYEQRFDSSPHNARQRVGLQRLDQIFTEGSCRKQKTRQAGQSLNNTGVSQWGCVDLSGASAP